MLKNYDQDKDDRSKLLYFWRDQDNGRTCGNNTGVNNSVLSGEVWVKIYPWKDPGLINCDAGKGEVWERNFQRLKSKERFSRKWHDFTNIIVQLILFF